MGPKMKTKKRQSIFRVKVSISTATPQINPEVIYTPMVQLNRELLMYDLKDIRMKILSEIADLKRSIKKAYESTSQNEFYHFWLTLLLRMTTYLGDDHYFSEDMGANAKNKFITLHALLKHAQQLWEKTMPMLENQKKLLEAEACITASFIGIIEISNPGHNRPWDIGLWQLIDGKKRTKTDSSRASDILFWPRMFGYREIIDWKELSEALYLHITIVEKQKIY